MIEQYLLQINESATVAKSKKFSHLNKALVKQTERPRFVGFLLNIEV